MDDDNDDHVQAVFSS